MSDSTPSPSIDTTPTSKLAIAALTLGIMAWATLIVGIGVVFGVTALLLGLVAQSSISSQAGRMRGEGMARTGAYLGGAAVVFALFLVLVALPLYQMTIPRSGHGVRMRGGTQARGIGQSLALYGNEHFDALPTGDVTQRMNILVRMIEMDHMLAYSRLDVAATYPVSTTLVAQNISFGLLNEQNPKWKNDTNATVPFITSRTLSSGRRGSVHTKSPTDPWIGNVAWGDNHVKFEVMQTLSTYSSTYDDIFDATVDDTLIDNP